MFIIHEIDAGEMLAEHLKSRRVSEKEPVSSRFEPERFPVRQMKA